MEFNVISLDVWGNDEDGYEVNDAHYTGVTVTLTENDTATEIVRKLVDIGYFSEESLVMMDHVGIKGDFDFSLYIDFKGVPDTELRSKRGI